MLKKGEKSMHRFNSKLILSAFLSVSLSSGLASAVERNPNTGDPNAAIRKANAANNPALAEFERVNRINNEMAVKHFTGLIEKSPKDASLYSKRGKAYSGLRDYANATKDYSQAISLDAKLTDAYMGRAVARYMQKDYNGSWDDVHKVESLGGKFWPSFLDALKAASKRDK
jgi:tetratricopeptide (TPR) repeat protein